MIQSGTLVTLLGWLITSPFANEPSILIIVEFKMTLFIGRVNHMSWNAYRTIRYANLRRKLGPHADLRIISYHLRDDVLGLTRQLRQPRILCCHCLPPGSLCVLGVLAHFHRAISYLKWYKIVCMRWLACTFSQIKLTCSLCFCTLGFPDISFGDLLRFDHITSLFSCLRRWMLTPNSSGNMQNHGYLICFHAASSRPPGKYIWGSGHLMFIKQSIEPPTRQVSVEYTPNNTHGNWSI